MRLPLVLCALAVTLHGSAQSKTEKTKKTNATEQTDKNADKKSSKKKKKDPYSKVFKDKPVEQAKGSFLSLYKQENRVWLELPRQQMGKPMMLTSTLSRVSEPTVLTVGKLTQEPIYLRFELRDSATVVMRSISTVAESRKLNSDQQRALEDNFFDPYVSAYPIAAWNTDSTAVLIDFSSVVANTSDMVNVLPKTMGEFKLSGSPKGGLNHVRAIKAFDNNVMVETDFSYSLTATIMGLIAMVSDMPATLSVKFNLLPLPPALIEPRVADARVGTGYVRKLLLPENQEGIRPLYLASRWPLQPTDSAALLAGRGSEVRKPIVFYVDTLLPRNWQEPVRRGVMKWDEAFRRLGYRGALQVKPFPKNDPLFDPDNVAYSCIRFIPASGGSVNTDVTVSPIDGQILHAGISLYNNLPEALRQTRFTLTAAQDRRARQNVLSQTLLEEDLERTVAHEVGLALGLVTNAAASAAVPTERLRQSTWTQQHGLSASIMDDMPLNYVAQPEDKGVRLAQTELGVYDYYAVDYLYRYLDHYSATEQAKQLEALVDSHAGDPWYRFAATSSLDPTASNNDLGNDPIAAANLGAKNVRTTMQHLQEWVADDNDSRKKDKATLLLAQQLHRLYNNVLSQVGGIKLQVAKPNTQVRPFTVVSRTQQLRALRWSIDMLRRFPTYANRALERRGFAAVSYYDQLIEYLVLELSNSAQRVVVSSFVDPTSLSQEDYYDALYSEVFRSLSQGNTLSEADRFMQRYFVEKAVAAVPASSRSGKATKSASRSLQAEELQWMDVVKAFEGQVPREVLEQLNLGTPAFGDPSRSLAPRVNATPYDRSAAILLGWLERLRPQLQRAVAAARNESARAHYTLLLHLVTNTLSPTSR